MRVSSVYMVAGTVLLVSALLYVTLSGLGDSSFSGIRIMWSGSSSTSHMEATYKTMDGTQRQSFKAEEGCEGR